MGCTNSKAVGGKKKRSESTNGESIIGTSSEVTAVRQEARVNEPQEFIAQQEVVRAVEERDDITVDNPLIAKRVQSPSTTSDTFHVPQPVVEQPEQVKSCTVISDYMTAADLISTNPIEAEVLINRAYKEINRDNIDHRMVLPKICKHKGDLLREKGSITAAIRCYEEAVEIVENDDPDSISMAECYYELAAWGPEEKQLEYEEKAVSLYQKHLPGSDKLAGTLVLYSMSLAEKHCCQEALKNIVHACELKRKVDPNSVYLGIVIGHTADLYFHLGDYGKAREYAYEAKNLYEKWGRKEKAAIYDEIIEMCEKQNLEKGESRCPGASVKCEQ